MSVDNSKRRKRDKETTAKVNTPEQASNATSAAVDLGSDNGALEGVAFEMELAENADLANGETVTLQLLEGDTADGSFAVAGVNSDLVQTGAGGIGAARATKQLRPNTKTKRFIAVKVTTSASAGADVDGKNCQVSTRH